MLSWDEAVMMPVGGGERRGDVLATLAGVVHRQLTSPEIADLIAAAADETDLDDWQRANLREIRRKHLHATALPEALVVGAQSSKHALRTDLARCTRRQRLARHRSAVGGTRAVDARNGRRPRRSHATSHRTTR